jgi:hypothetical protein
VENESQLIDNLSSLFPKNHPSSKKLLASSVLKKSEQDSKTKNQSLIPMFSFDQKLSNPHNQKPNAKEHLSEKDIISENSNLNSEKSEYAPQMKNDNLLNMGNKTNQFNEPQEQRLFSDCQRTPKIRQESLMKETSNKNTYKTRTSHFSSQTISIDAIESKIHTFNNGQDFCENENLYSSETQNENPDNKQIIVLTNNNFNSKSLNDSNSENKKHTKYKKNEICNVTPDRNKIKRKSSEISNLQNIPSVSIETPARDEILIKKKLSKSFENSNMSESDSNNGNNLFRFPYKPPIENKQKLSPETKYNYSITDDSVLRKKNENNSIAQVGGDPNQYSIFDSKKQAYSLANMTNSFKESDFQLQISFEQNKNFRKFSNTVKLDSTNQDLMKENPTRSKFSTNGCFKSDRILNKKIKNPIYEEMSFAKENINLKVNDHEEHFKETLEELPMDSITLKTQSLDNQPFNFFDTLSKSKLSSKKTEKNIKVQFDNMSSYVSETEIIRNFEKFDPRGTILKKLIIKYNILTGTTLFQSNIN